MHVRPMLVGDVAGVVALQRACFPEPFPADQLWQGQHLLAHLITFPEGQFVADIKGQIVGSASALRISEATWQAHLPWEETLGGFEFRNYEPHGTTLYGADISVHPGFRRRGIARALYEARFACVRQLGLVRYGTACRIPDFAGSGFEDPGAYCQAVSERQRQDRTLSPLLAMGLTLVDVIRDYMPDPESGDSAALLEWIS
ncbi:MAG: GNAT family N-acetyltransferase [Chthonomonas sp.]|nr:GNAT family N-acetyltransferase [Chthonomonas sp.]